ncbi:unnamed protein product [Wuchereria bancrofti]|uniref:Uncharacterized protein n=1 Tax=Wuchereria bancrofti TaxID=6293 RepID=A0A3P7DYN4_WUCBA|nr:unnamed protein product [Wuchereria bancrofti]
MEAIDVKMAAGAEAVAECLKRTLEPNAQIRRIAENDLKQMEQLPGKLLIMLANQYKLMIIGMLYVISP